jgi:hypothetical protein
MPTNFWGKSALTATQKAIFGFGRTPQASPPSARPQNITNLVSSTGVVATDTPGVGTARNTLTASGYGGDKAMFAFGSSNASPSNSTLNLVSNTGVVASDTSTGTPGAQGRAAAIYGGDKAIFGFGTIISYPAPFVTSITNLVSNTGVFASDTPGVTPAGRNQLSAAGYGGDKAIFGFGSTAPGAPFIQLVSTTNLVSNTGVVASDTPGVASIRYQSGAAGYGGDKVIFAYGVTGVFPSSSNVNTINLVSNTGVMASDTPGVGTARGNLGSAGYGGDKAIFGFGTTIPNTPSPGNTSITNLVSNTGVMASDTPGVGTARISAMAAGYSTTA